MSGGDTGRCAGFPIYPLSLFNYRGVERLNWSHWETDASEVHFLLWTYHITCNWVAAVTCVCAFATFWSIGFGLMSLSAFWVLKTDWTLPERSQTFSPCSILTFCWQTCLKAAVVVYCSVVLVNFFRLGLINCCSKCWPGFYGVYIYVPKPSELSI